MGLIDRLRTRWQEWTGEEDTPFDGDAPAWAVSVGIHFVGVLILGLWFLPEIERRVTLTVNPDPVEEVEEIKPLEEVYFQNEPTEEIAANSENGAEAAEAMAQVFAEESVVAHEITETTTPTVNVEVNMDVATSPNVHPNMNVRGSPIGSGVTGASGAVDRITYEILDSLDQRKTLVVWLFDSTLSLKSQRADIGSRFSKIYEELGLLEKGKNSAFTKHTDEAPLLSAAIAYGQGVQYLTAEPTADVEALNKAVQGIQSDDTGLENTFSAVLQAVGKYGTYRTEKRRNVMFVVVTDEVGSDSANPTMVEQAIAATRRYQIPVYTVGVPAPFGRETIPFRFVSDDPKFAETEYWLPAEQGPESRFPELVKLAFWGEQNQEQYEYIDSGFGPYQLTRLSAETGGIYFSVHPNRTREGRATGRGGRGQTPKNTTLIYQFWDPAIMRPYTPEYMTDREYDTFVKSNKARVQLLLAASYKRDVGALQSPMLRFVKKDEGSLGAAITDAQKASATLGPKLNELLGILKQGEADRAKLTGPRWQAGFDLCYGRVMAQVVRTDGYNMMLAQAKSGKAFKDPKNNTWVLEPSEEVNTGSSAQKMADTAKALLQRVVKDHEGTPWAMLAAKELETPFGWTWKEEFTEIPKENPNAGNGNAAPPANTPVPGRKPMAPKPKI